MTSKALLDSPLWEQFQSEAIKRQRDPVELLMAYIRQCLEIWLDEELDAEISREAQLSGYTEDDAVELVRAYRREKKEQRAIS